MPNPVSSQAPVQVDQNGATERERRAEARERLRRLHERVAARNQDLTEEQALAIAEEITREIIDDLVARGEISFERDRA